MSWIDVTYVSVRALAAGYLLCADHRILQDEQFECDLFRVVSARVICVLEDLGDAEFAGLIGRVRSQATATVSLVVMK